MNRVALIKLVRAWQSTLALDHWRIDIVDESPGDDAYAITWYSDDYDAAELRFNPEWDTWDTEQLNRIIAHELLHIHLRDIDQLYGRTVRHLGSEAQSFAQEAFSHEIEGLVDRLAQCWARTV